MTITRFFLIPVALSLFACASQEPKQPKTTDSIITLIQVDGSKQFSYTLIMEMPDRGGRPQGGPGGRGGGKGGPPPGGPDGKRPGGPGDFDRADDDHDDGRLKHLTEEGLLAKLEDTGYCRNGYQQLETQSRRGAMNIAGECYDKATDEDRKKFPNPEPKKVIEERLD
ncbi:MAG: hypothetical protein AAGC78_13215 [Cellvibrio sp.]|uniref:hypothetical protein n=1 Tax=Cellvibrio sp. TaxID=1965322 RepID=UPI0031A4A00F